MVQAIAYFNMIQERLFLVLHVNTSENTIVLFVISTQVLIWLHLTHFKIWMELHGAWLGIVLAALHCSRVKPENYVII